jgi:predicted nucleic acid-binding protein
MTPTLVDSNILLDIATRDPTWFDRSSRTLETAANESALVINTIIYAEVSIRFKRIEDLETAIPPSLYHREPLPFEAAFLAGKVFLRYRRQGGSRIRPLPDFFIGAHAAIAQYRLLTRDARRYRTYFPSVELVSP